MESMESKETKETKEAEEAQETQEGSEGEEAQEVISLGWYDHQNCGDESFKEALRVLFPEVDFVFINNLSQNIDLINSSSYLLIGGGNIVTGEFLSGLNQITTPYSFIGVGLVGDSPLGFLQEAELVLVRDITSQRRFRQAYYIPDLAFSLTPEEELGKRELKRIPYIDSRKKTVGVFLNDCVSASFYSTILKFVEAEKAKLELARFLENLSYNVVFFPMSFSPPDDRRISFDVIGKMNKGYKYTCITDPFEPVNCLSIVSALDYAITMRLHASIFCTIAGIPFIDLLHHDKNKGYLETNGLENLGLDYYELSIKSLSDKFAYLERDYERISNTLIKIGRENKRQLGEVIKNVHIPRRR